MGSRTWLRTGEEEGSVTVLRFSVSTEDVSQESKPSSTQPEGGVYTGGTSGTSIEAVRRENRELVDNRRVFDEIGRTTWESDERIEPADRPALEPGGLQTSTDILPLRFSEAGTVSWYGIDLTFGSGRSLRLEQPSKCMPTPCARAARAWTTKKTSCTANASPRAVDAPIIRSVAFEPKIVLLTSSTTRLRQIRLATDTAAPTVHRTTPVLSHKLLNLLKRTTRVHWIAWERTKTTRKASTIASNMAATVAVILTDDARCASDLARMIWVAKTAVVAMDAVTPSTAGRIRGIAMVPLVFKHYGCRRRVSQTPAGVEGGNGSVFIVPALVGKRTWVSRKAVQPPKKKNHPNDYPFPLINSCQNPLQRTASGASSSSSDPRTGSLAYGLQCVSSEKLGRVPKAARKKKAKTNENVQQVQRRGTILRIKFKAESV